VLIADDEAALTTFAQLRELGVHIALDDFGTGYSSLRYLHRFPFDKIKIDRAFVKEVTDDTGSSSIIKAVVGIAAERNMITTAEASRPGGSSRRCAISAAPRCRAICSARRARRMKSGRCWDWKRL
jgi:predicted signal transduction protein with EAL and GGDEF domain